MELRIGTNCLMEIGIFKKLPNLISDEGYKEILIVADEGFGNTEKFSTFVEKVESMESLASKIIRISGSNEPTYDDLEGYRSQLGEYRPDLVLGIGGGSAMDVAKAIGALITNIKPALEYRGFDALESPGIDVYLVPTTAGTGSEASYNASFVDTTSRKKMGINGNFMFAKKSFLDGSLLLSCPRFSALGAAIDAITHSVEGFTCNNSNLVSDNLAIAALKALWSGLNVFNEDNWNNVEDWQSLLLGAHLGGIIQMNSGSGVAAAISYPLSVYYGVPHGIGGGMFLWDIAGWNVDKGFEKYKYLSQIIGCDFDASLVVKRFKDRFEELGVPQDLSTFSIWKTDHSDLCQRMGTQQPAFDQNPIPFSVEHDFPDFIKRYLV